MELTGYWVTRRGGLPITAVDGWGLGEPWSHDLVALKAELKRLPTEPEWLMRHISPVSTLPSDHTSIRVNRQFASVQSKTHLDKVAKQTRFIGLLQSGQSATAACKIIGMSPHTYAQWRREKDFYNAVEAVRHGRDLSNNVQQIPGVNSTFATRRRYFWGYETFPHHQKIIDAIETCPEGEITLILLPPESGKTTLLTDYICDRIAMDPNSRTMYVSERAEGQARKVLEDIQDRLLDTTYADPDSQYPPHVADFQTRYGPFHDAVVDADKPWNQNHIKVSKASGRRDYTVEIAGWNTRIYGARTDLLVFDDVQSDTSVNETEKMLRRIRKTFLTRPGRKGRTIVIGQRLAAGDLYERLIEENMVRRLVIIPALDVDEQPYCPEMWPLEALEQKRRLVNEDVWWAAYMQDPRKTDDQTFTDEDIDGCKDIDAVACRRPEAGAYKVVCALDPALGGGTALFVAAYSYTDFRIIDCIVNYRVARNEDIFTMIKDMARYRFTDLIVERNATQRGIARDQRLRDLATRFGFRIREHETGNNKWDVNFGVGAMAGSFIRREVHIPWADPFAESRMRPLLDELRNWRPGVSPRLQRQDMVMAMWFAWLHWQRQKDAMDVDLSQWERQGTPWQPGDMSNRWAAPYITSGKQLVS